MCTFLLRQVSSLQFASGLQSGAELTFCLLLMEVSNPFLHGRFLLKVSRPRCIGALRTISAPGQTSTGRTSSRCNESVIPCCISFECVFRRCLATAVPMLGPCGARPDAVLYCCQLVSHVCQLCHNVVNTLALCAGAWLETDSSECRQ